MEVPDELGLGLACFVARRPEATVAPRPRPDPPDRSDEIIFSWFGVVTDALGKHTIKDVNRNI